MVNIEVPINYTSTSWEELREQVRLLKQYIVNEVWDIIKWEILSSLPNIKNLHFDQLMEDISDEEKYDIDMKILREVLSYIKTHKIDNILSININPSTLINPKFIKNIIEIFLELNFHEFIQLEIEITENGYFTPEQIKILNENIKRIQSIWIKIWIDDYPNNNNNNELLDKINGIDFVKIDKYPLISYVNWDIDQKTLIEVIWVYIHDIQNRVGRDVDIVIEWVETEELVDLIKKNFWENIKFFQWYYFHKNEDLT